MEKYERAIMAARHIIDTNETVREIAKVFGVSKSTIHTDLTERLKESHSPLYPEVTAILEEHRRVRHLRGGAATKAKFADLCRKAVSV
jgi:putative DeoR family transcriptional regulator (stage III sporulation protein D)